MLILFILLQQVVRNAMTSDIIGISCVITGVCRRLSENVIVTRSYVRISMLSFTFLRTR
jgi:hypothetical protein